MSAFLIIIILVAAAALVVALLRATGVVRSPKHGRHGATWIDHPGDVPVEERPSEDAVDDPVPVVPHARH